MDGFALTYISRDIMQPWQDPQSPWASQRKSNDSGADPLKELIGACRLQCHALQIDRSIRWGETSDSTLGGAPHVLPSRTHDQYVDHSWWSPETTSDRHAWSNVDGQYQTRRLPLSSAWSS